MQDDSNRIPVNTKLLTRFFSKIRIDPSITFNGSPCWLWTAWTDKDGYGRLWFNGLKPYAHRLAYGMFVGMIPDGLENDHLCRVRNCVNPAHSESVTPKVNTHRGNSFTGINARKTHCVHGHPFTKENTRISVKIPGSPRRICRSCMAPRQAAYRLRERLKRASQNSSL